jgi:hypothetical protein
MTYVARFRGLQRFDKVDATKHGPSVARMQFVLATDFPTSAPPEPVGRSLFGWLASRGR